MLAQHLVFFHCSHQFFLFQPMIFGGCVSILFLQKIFTTGVCMNARKPWLAIKVQQILCKLLCKLNLQCKFNLQKYSKYDMRICNTHIYSTITKVLPPFLFSQQWVLFSKFPTNPVQVTLQVEFALQVQLAKKLAAISFLAS